MNSKEALIAAVAAADRFFASRPWQSIECDQLFAIEIDGQPPIAGSILGSKGLEPGLVLAVGPRAIEEMLGVSKGELSFNEIESKSLWLTLTRRKMILPPFDRALLAARREGRMGPLFLAKDASGGLRPPRKPEFEFLLAVLDAIAKVTTGQANGGLDFDFPSDSSRISTLVVRGTGAATEVEILHRQAPPPAAAPGFAVSSAAAQLASLPAIDARYAAIITRLPIDTEPQGEPLRALMVIDIDDGRLLVNEFLDGDPTVKAREKLLRLFTMGSPYAPRGRPSTLLVCECDLHARVAPEMLGAGIDCRFEPHVPEMTEVVTDLDDHLRGFAADERGDGPVEVAGPDDLDGWRAAAEAATEVLSRLGSEAAVDDDEAWRKYLGCRPEETGSESPALQDWIHSAYIDWYCHLHRATADSQTIAERALTDTSTAELTEAVRAVIAARAAATPSLYRIETIAVGEWVTLLDVLTGATHRVTDESLSLTAREGIVFPAHVYQAGAFEFASLAGPPLPPLRVFSAMRFLESECGLQLDGGIPVEGAHLLGRLWMWNENLPDIAPDVEVREVTLPETLDRTPEAVIEALYMGWLDDRIPALDDKTPRETCRTAAGRCRVARLIRSYPDPADATGARVPRAKMLAELGLETVGATDAACATG
ncbi:MAG: hypothetical protein U1E73_10015 [Planctomycetota bacterium]